MKSIEIKYRGNGNKESEIEYLNGKPHGRYQDWYSDGQPCEDSNYINGEKHGRCQICYHSGTIWVDSNYVHGTRHGRYQRCHANGQILINKYYINNVECTKEQWDELNKPECSLGNCSDDEFIAELKRRMK